MISWFARPSSRLWDSTNTSTVGAFPRVQTQRSFQTSGLACLPLICWHPLHIYLGFRSFLFLRPSLFQLQRQIFDFQLVIFDSLNHHIQSYVFFLLLLFSTRRLPHSKYRRLLAGTQELNSACVTFPCCILSLSDGVIFSPKHTTVSQQCHWQWLY